MCGIAGIICLDRQIKTDKNLVQKMCNSMQHRGSDAHGIAAIDHIVFGHQRLSIIDLSPGANQPFWSVDKNIVLVLNGEIYNYQVLKKELLDFNFSTTSDTEVLMAAYQKWGIAMVNRIKGMFAIAIHDKNKNISYLVRDRIGKKPLYYSRNGHQLIFASEIRAILATGLISPEINKTQLAYYLQYQTVHAPETMVKDIKMLSPGSILSIIDGNISETNYWQTEKNLKKPDQEYNPHEIANLFEKSVEERLVSDVPFAVLLSAGVDSNLILAMASKFEKVNTFTIGFKEKKYDESVLASKAAAHFGSNHQQVILDSKSLLSILPDMLSAMDHPSGDGANTFLISKIIKENGYTMALSGLGGDELFFGYPHYAQYGSIANSIAFKTLPNTFFTLLQNLPHHKIRKLSALKKCNHAAEAMMQIRANYNAKGMHNYFGLDEASLNLTQFEGLDNFNAISAVEMEYYMADVLLRDADQMSMAHSLELRNPFLDKDLVLAVTAINQKHKTLQLPKKMLLDILGHLLPDYIINKPKTGFTFPWEYWMKTELNSFCAAQMEYLENSKIFKTGAIEMVWKKFNRNSKIFTWSRVWPLVSLSYWIQKNGIKT